MKRILILLAVVVAITSCNKEQQTAPNCNWESVRALADDFIFDGEQTKTVITQDGESAPSFAWKEGDVIGVIPMDNETVQSNYKISSIGSDPKTATFDGGVWSLKEGKGYASYYPYQKEAVLSGESLEISFLGQTQSENNSLAHIGAYDYMYASGLVASSESVSFNFKHLVSLVRLQITVTKTDQYSKLTLESAAGNWFANTASLSLTDGTTTPSQSSNRFSVALNDISVSSGEVLTVWFAMLPTSILDGNALSVRLFGKNSYGTASILDVSTFEAGKAYSFSCTAESWDDTGFVDLGLSVKWAPCNIGAATPYEYGDYYAWGETETKSDYRYDTYFDYNNYDLEPIKYNLDNMVLEPEDDVAHVKLGDGWRIPTVDECYELMENCTHTFITIGEVDGVMFTSTKEGYTDKSIFLPVNDDVSDVHSLMLWCSSLQSKWLANVLHLIIDDGIECMISGTSREYPLPVRPVFD